MAGSRLAYVDRWGRGPTLAAAIAGMVAVVFLARELGGWTLILAIALGAAALLGLLYADDRLVWIDRYPVLRHLLRAYISAPQAFEPSTTAPPRPTAFASPPDAPASRSAPSRDPPLPVPDIRGFVGVGSDTEPGSIMARIRDLIADPGLVKESRYAGCVFLLGPPGTGKTSLAQYLCHKLADPAVRAVAKGRVFQFHEAELTALNTAGGMDEEILEGALRRMTAALGGIILLDNLDRLTTIAGGQLSLRIGEVLGELFESTPRRLLIVGTGSPQAYARLDPSRRWLHKLAPEKVEFKTFSEIDTTNLIVKCLNQDPNPSPEVMRVIRDAAEGMVETPSFENAYTIHRYTDWVSARQRRRGQARGSAPVLTKEDFDGVRWER